MQTMTKKNKFKLYAGDGGGCFGAIPAYLNMSYDRISEFDGFIGTSIHAAICGAYAMGVPCDEVDRFMGIDMKKVFSRPWYYSMRWHGPKWPDKELNEAIQRLVGKDTRLGDVKKPLFITAMNFKHDIPKVFGSMNEDDKDLLLWEVIRCSVAANTYFPTWNPYHDDRKDFFTDGGTWANTPSMAGLCALVDKMGIPVSRATIFSVGCGMKPDPDRKQKDVDGWNTLQMAVPTIDSMFDGGNERAMTYMADALINKRLVRFNKVTLKKKWGMDDPSLINKELIPLAETVIEDYKKSLGGFLDVNA